MNMHSPAAGDFRKTAECPSSQTLLSYHRHQLAITDRVSIQIHLHKCDFCNAELHLLMRHRGEVGESSCAKMPTQLRELAERFLTKNNGTVAPLTSFSERYHLSH
jgi:hypothetical protein